jgi:hypothetical protein
MIKKMEKNKPQIWDVNKEMNSSSPSKGENTTSPKTTTKPSDQVKKEQAITRLGLIREAIINNKSILRTEEITELTESFKELSDAINERF